MTWQTIRHLFYTTSRFLHHFEAIGEFKFQLQSETLNSPQNWQTQQMTLKNNEALVLCYFKLWAVFCSHWHIQTGATVWTNTQFSSKSTLFEQCDLETWWMTMKNYKASLLNNKLCASFHHHMWIQTAVMVRKQQNWVFDLCHIDLWSLTFCMDITFVTGNYS